MKVNMIGIRLNMRAWIGSAGAGFSLVCTHCVMPIRIGQMPIDRNAGMNAGT